MLASPASTTVRISNGSTPSWSEWIEPDRVLRLADRARAEAGARPVADGVVERRADDRDVHVARPQVGRVGDPGQLHERRQADVGGQVEVVEGLVRAVPAVARREVDVARGRGRSATMASGGGSPSTGRGTRPVPPSRRAAGSGPPSSGARGRHRTAVSRPRSRRRGTRARPPRRAPGRSRRSRAVWATSVAASSIVRSARGRAAASRNSIEWPGVGSSVIASSGWIAGTTHETLAMSVEPDAGSMPSSTIPYASAFATQRARERAVVLHRRRAARELDLDLDVRGRARRPRTARENRGFMTSS